ncbi:MAG: hypothetical protein ACTSQA_00265 [Candidatus Heimdallarchaeaceae archaeon]
MASNVIISAADFDQILNEYAGRTITHTPVTKTTSNITGEETLIDGTPVSIKCYVMKTNQSFNYKEAGFIELGDMVGLFKIADNVSINSKFTVNGEVFQAKESFDVPGVFNPEEEAQLIYTSCNLYKLE